MKKQNDGGDAFPMNFDSDGGVRYPGMTLRAYFAAAAMKGILTNPQTLLDSYVDNARAAVENADALIKELGE